MLAKLLPSFLKNTIYVKLASVVRESRVKAEKAIPKVSLEKKHIEHLKVLVSREEMLSLFPKGGVVAEFGVDHGNFSELIFKFADPAKLHLVDVWGDAARFHDGLKTMVGEKFAKEIAAKKVEINVGYSTDVMSTFQDNYFDWVYIDTDHSYALTAKELAGIKNKMKPGGIIAGHDYTIGNWIDGVRYGVIEAVHEFCVKENWELIYLTIETHHYRSFAIRKL